MITELGCDMAQGFFVARPMRSDLVVEWVACYSDSAIIRGMPIVSHLRIDAESA
jgi:predicted signal transduction protein with EAL and GGDEF domain